MSKFIKVAAIIAIAAVAMGARMMASSGGADAAASAVTSARTIAPLEMMRAAGPLPQTEVASYF